MIKKFISYYKPYIRLFTLDLICAFFIAAVDLVYPLISKYALNTLLPQEAFRAFYVWMLIIVAAYILKGLFQFAKLYGEYMQFDVNQYTVDSVVGYFGEHRILDPELFSMVCDTFRSSDNISVIADIDFERGNISVLEKGADDWHTYRLSDVLSAVRASEGQSDLFDYERKAIFEEQLDGKELEITADAASEDESALIQM